MGVKEGDKVKVEYTGKLEDGTIFDSSQHGEHSHPIEFVVGAHQVIPGFEDNVLGMEIDDEREFSIKPENAYGEHREELVREFPRSQIPLDKEPQEGMVLGMMTPDGRQMHATIKKVTPENITLDLNHPLAGKVLIFNIKLTDIVPKDELEKEAKSEEPKEEKKEEAKPEEKAEEKSEEKKE